MIYHSTETSEVLSHFEVDPQKGLPTGVADQRYAKYGGNVLTKAKKTPLLSHVQAQLKNPVNLLLITCALMALIINFIYPAAPFYSFILVILILAVNVAVSVIHQNISENTSRSLETMNIPRVKVLRDGIIKIIDSAYIVPGDILVLETGDYVAADARLIESFDFRCDETFVTGEALTAEKEHYAILDDITPVEKRSNMVFCGSNVITGHARAVVTETGMYTELGKTVTLQEEYNTVNVKIKEKLSKLGKISGVILCIFSLLSFFTYVLINFRSDLPFITTLTTSALNSVALLVSVLPHGLPVMALVAMGTSVKALLHKGMLTKDFAVFDRLPEVSVICADKTGTLTKDRMVVEKVFDGNEITDADMAFSSPDSVSVLRLASLCTSQSKADVDSPMYGDATELAIIHAFEQSVIKEERDIENNYPTLSKLPFDTQRKITLSVNMIDGAPYAIIKGAPDFLIAATGNEGNEALIQTVNSFAESGMRVIAVAYKILSEIPSNLDYCDFESGFTFSGLIALSDPPQDDIVSLIKECEQGSVKTVMITGDHTTTAVAVAKRLGILKSDDAIISGEELDKLTDEELTESVDKYSVFARLLPDQKLRIVSALKAKRHTVAITGDSVNDAPALKAADVGIAMGNRGTDVARGAADMIMNDNGFAAIITAIKTSQGLFCAIRKTLTYLLSSYIGKIFAVLICLFSFGAFPLSALQFLLLNLLTDTFPALSILSDGIYEHKPLTGNNKADKSLLTSRSALSIAIQGIMMAAVSVIAYGISKNSGAEFASSMIFTVLVSSQILNMTSAKFEGLFFRYKHFRKFTHTVILGALCLVSLFLVISPMGVPFGFATLPFGDFIKAVLLSLTVFVTGEGTKLGFLLYEKLKNK